MQAVPRNGRFSIAETRREEAGDWLERASDRAVRESSMLRMAQGGSQMNIAITFRQMDSTDAVKGYAHDKVGRLQKFLRDPMKGQVKLSCQSRQHHAEVDIHAGGSHYHAHETSEDMYASIDKVIDKLERQIRGSKSSQKGKERASQRLLEDAGED